MKCCYETEELSQVREKLLWRLNTSTHIFLNPGMHHTEVCEYSWWFSFIIFLLLITYPTTSTSHPSEDHTSENPGTMLTSAQKRAPWVSLCKNPQNPQLTEVHAYQPLSKPLRVYWVAFFYYINKPATKQKNHFKKKKKAKKEKKT